MSNNTSLENDLRNSSIKNNIFYFTLSSPKNPKWLDTNYEYKIDENGNLKDFRILPYSVGIRITFIIVVILYYAISHYLSTNGIIEKSYTHGILFIVAILIFVFQIIVTNRARTCMQNLWKDHKDALLNKNETNPESLPKDQ